MNILVIYDSVFGNTEQIARAIAGAFGSEHSVTTVRPADTRPEQLSGADLIVAGSPTRGWRPTEPMQALLKTLPGLKGKRAAAFDTRMSAEEARGWFMRFILSRGVAADKIAAALAGKGAKLARSGEGFYVLDNEGPLKPGELERAAAWARSLL